MSRKLLARFLALPKDFRWRELVRLLALFGYILLKPGKTAGSARKFVHDSQKFLIVHEPHPGSIVPSRTMRYVRKQLQERGQL